VTEEKVEIVPPQPRSPAWKLAEAEISFEGGLLDGVKLTGFTIAEGRDGKLRLTMPQKEYMKGGQKQYWDFIQPVLHTTSIGRLRDLIFAEYDRWKAAR
jgi:hypothetical protein